LTMGGNPLVPFVPTRRENLDTIFQVLELREGDVFYDLGCGDGRVVIEAVKRYPIKRAVCVETRRDLIEEAKANAEKAGVKDKIDFVQGDFFKVPIGDATAVYMYLLTSINEALKPKLEKELKPGTRVVTLDFPISGWKPVKVVETSGVWQRKIYLYIIGESNKQP